MNAPKHQKKQVSEKVAVQKRKAISDGEIYAEVSRRADPDGHAAVLDKLIEEVLANVRRKA